MATQEEIIESIAENLGLPPGDLDMEASLQDDLGLNPVEVADLMHHLASHFQITFDSHETEAIRTVGDLIVLIEDKLLE